jgi:hypothetical protein
MLHDIYPTLLVIHLNRPKLYKQVILHNLPTMKTYKYINLYYFST